MYTSLIALGVAALASSVSAQAGAPIFTGTQCENNDFVHCQAQGAFGCLQIPGGGPNCVDQTKNCDEACLSMGYSLAYQKDQSDDATCVCSNQDAGAPSNPPVNPSPPPVLTGPQCRLNDLDFCKDQGAFGCVQLEGPNCVDQTTHCDKPCLDNGLSYAYQKHASDDLTCVCTSADASGYSFIPAKRFSFKA